MSLDKEIAILVVDAVKSLYGIETSVESIQTQQTKRECEGDITVVTFPFIKLARKSPEQLGSERGDYLLKSSQEIESYNVIKGFLNLAIKSSYWINRLNTIYGNRHYGINVDDDHRGVMMVEYSSPNTNKPLHLGHIRNNLLCYSISKIQDATGWAVRNTIILNDRGRLVCN